MKEFMIQPSYTKYDMVYDKGTFNKDIQSFNLSRMMNTITVSRKTTEEQTDMK